MGLRKNLLQEGLTKAQEDSVLRGDGGKNAVAEVDGPPWSEEKQKVVRFTVSFQATRHRLRYKHEFDPNHHDYEHDDGDYEDDDENERTTPPRTRG